MWKKRIPFGPSYAWATGRLVAYLSPIVLKGFDKVVAISGSSRSVRESVSVNGVDFFVNIDFFGDDFFRGCIVGSIRRGTVREPRGVVYSCFNGETGWFGYLAAFGTLSWTRMVLARASTWMLRNTPISLKPASTSSSSSSFNSLDKLSFIIIPPPLTLTPSASLLSYTISQFISFFYLKITS